MSSLQSLQQRRERLVEQIAGLGPMRKGSITAQFFKAGAEARRGPYPLYTCKQGNRTRSRRIPQAQQSFYAEQIKRYRQFQALMSELVEVSEQLADLALVEENAGGKKNSRKRSKPNSRPRRHD